MSDEASRRLAWWGARTEAQRAAALELRGPVGPIALILKDGSLEPVEGPDASRWDLRIRRPMPFEVPRKVKLTRAQRREAARRFSGRGRRRARPGPERDYLMRRWAPMPDVDVYKAHLLSDGMREVRLFLLDGKSVTDEICRDVVRWLARAGVR